MKATSRMATAEHAVGQGSLERADDPAAILTAALGKVLHTVIGAGADPLRVGVELVSTPHGVTARAAGRVKA